MSNVAAEQGLRVGVVYPSTELGDDPGLARAWLVSLEGLGFHHVHIWDHVLGAGLGSRPDWEGTWNASHAFPEPLTTLAWMAALTTRVELVTGILILPQRQTALVAKQAAQVSVLSGGRLRLGVGVGHNSVEYDALGWPFRRRGRRLDEQLPLLRALWQQETVKFEGEFDRIEDAGINPRPVSPIPLWVGGGSPAAIERVARLGDGWLGRGRINDLTLELLELLRRAVAAAGRSISEVGIDGRVDTAVPPTIAARHATMQTVPPDEWASDAAAWQRAGATHVTFNPLFGGMRERDHLAFLVRLADAIRPLLRPSTSGS